MLPQNRSERSQTALDHTQRLMTSEPRLAAEQATEILKVAPGHPLATLLLGVAHRRAGDAAASQSVLEPLAQSQPNWAPRTMSSA